MRSYAVDYIAHQLPLNIEMFGDFLFILQRGKQGSHLLRYNTRAMHNTDRSLKCSDQLSLCTIEDIKNQPIVCFDIHPILLLETELFAKVASLELEKLLHKKANNSSINDKIYRHKILLAMANFV